MLLYIGGGIVETLVADEAERPFLAQLRSGWVSDLNGEELPEALRLLSERLNPDNYTFETRDENAWPSASTGRKRSSRGIKKTFSASPRTRRSPAFPSGCGDCSIQMSVFRRTSFLSFGSSSRALKTSRQGSPMTATLCIRSRICSAALSRCSSSNITTGSTAEPERMAWCRSKLESVVRQPPAPLRFDSAGADGDENGIPSAGEAGVVLLARDRNDPLARRLVAV